MPKTALCERKVDFAYFPVVCCHQPDFGVFRCTATMLRIMRMLSFFLFVACLSAVASGTSQSVTFTGEKLTMNEVFTAVEAQTGYVVLYGPELFPKRKTLSLRVENLALTSLMDMIVADHLLQYKMADKTIFITRKLDEDYAIITNNIKMVGDQQSRLQIHVTDQEKNSLAGATVINKNTKQSTITDENGRCSIIGNIGDVIEITYVGYSAQRFTVKEIGRNISIQLNANDLLEEAVVYNGYQKIQQKYLTGSVTSLKMDSIMQPGLSSVDKMLEGRVPGMMFMQNSGQAGAAPKLRIRGTNTYLGSREPLWVVDGIVRTNPFPIDPQRLNDPDFVNLLGNAISGLNPFDIEQIDVLKDATAAALYGVRAANGVIVITTKRGKPGPPSLNFNTTTTFTQRPKYTDNGIFMMNSRERVDVSREMIERQLKLRGAGYEAYEVALLSYYNGEIDFETLQRQVGKAETMNTDWLGNVMQDVWGTNHNLSVSGGTQTASYRASVGYRSEPGVIKKEKSDLYTASLNTQMKYRRFIADFNVQLNKGKKHYNPSEVGLLNYAFGTSRSIPLYNQDGSLYFYSTINSDPNSTVFHSLNRMNIVNEMNNTGEVINTNEYNASLDLSYEISKSLQLRSRLAYTGGSSYREIWFDENTEWAYQLRQGAYNSVNNVFTPLSDPMPFGGELRNQSVNRSNYLINTRLHFSSYIDKQNHHQLSADLAADVTSTKTHSFTSTKRGYYRNRGRSFGIVDITAYRRYAEWVANQGRPVVMEELSNAVRPFFTSTYIFKDKLVFSGTASQEFSNSFGSRSNERFLPTWALSGRWNFHNDLFGKQTWLDDAALLVSFGTRGNMLTGQTINTTMTKGALNTILNEFGSTITHFPNPDLAWEKTQDYSGTFIFSVLNARIRGSLGYFFSRTTNAFMNMKVSAVNGAPSNTYVVNAGILENQGVELTLNFKVIDNMGSNSKKGFMWRMDPQLGQVFNRLLNRSINSRNVLVDDAALTYNDYLQGKVPVDGKSVNTFYSYKFKTLDNRFGYPIFYDAEPENKVALTSQYNKLTKGELFESVLTESGRREPVLQGGISNSFSYGNWSLNVNFSYSVGNKVRLLKISSGNYGTYRPTGQQNLRKEFVDRWRYPGDELYTNIPAIQGAVRAETDHYAWWINSSNKLNNPIGENYYQMYDFSDIRVVSGDFVKLQSASLSYRIPNEFCKRWHCKGGIVSFNGNNLFVIANKALRGQDPAQSGASPNINLSIRPVYAININISF